MKEIVGKIKPSIGVIASNNFKKPVFLRMPEGQIIKRGPHLWSHHTWRNWDQDQNGFRDSAWKFSHWNLLSPLFLSRSLSQIQVHLRPV